MKAAMGSLFPAVSKIAIGIYHLPVKASILDFPYPRKTLQLG
jgi:hypothetical protein